MIVFDDLACQIIKQGEDERCLRRWNNITLTGKKIKANILTCYCPVLSSFTGSAYSQQLIYMAENNGTFPANIVCPRKLFRHDLKVINDEYMTLSHQLLSRDYNSEYK